MIDISITDQYGYNINNDSTFIIIKTNQIYKLLKKKASHKNTIIYEADYSMLSNELNSQNIDLNNFVPLGDIYYDGISRPNTIILCNKNKTVFPTNYIDIQNYGNGKIMMPVHSSAYVAFGLIYINNKEDLKISNVALISKDYLIDIKKNIDPRLIRNELYLLSHTTKCLFSLNREGKYINDPHFMKITNIENKYLTMTNDNPKLKNKLHSKKQNISYNIQGELMIDDKCLTHKNTEVYFDKCKKKQDQLWKIHDNMIYPTSEPEKCLSTFGENIKIKSCSSDKYDESVIWNIEESDVEKSTDYKLKKYAGKTMVLVDSDDPWYLNRDTTIPMIYNRNMNLSDKNYRNNADFKVSTNNNEHFEDVTKNNKNDTMTHIYTYIILLLLLIVIILIIYKYTKNTK
jgi:hypothetical protein